MPSFTAAVRSLVQLPSNKSVSTTTQPSKQPLEQPTTYHRTLVPGQAFPDVRLPKLGGGELSLRSSSGKPRIIVVYRGAFCPFCVGTLQQVRDQKHKLDAAGIEVVVVSADKREVAEELAARLQLPADLEVGYGLTEDQMHQLGLFVSSPTHYIAQEHKFSEPAAFMLTPAGTVKYLEYASMPMGGRINIDNYIAGYQWSTQNAKEHPEFNSVVWGSVPQPALSQQA